ncbi:MAG TPA: XrtA system polysaccharide deacetylase [Vicinamibacterales bacterium]|nr:XrtA system polysaccharide deacetylase [Vicinamibacterales bacterium]
MNVVMNAMTVDVEDYFHATAFDRVVSRADGRRRPSARSDRWGELESRVVPNTHRLLELFAANNVRATFFILGWVAERFPQLVRDIADGGHELASHGFHHQLVYLLTPEQFRHDVRRARAVIEDAAGLRVRGYRAPSFSIVKQSLWALDVLIEEGHTYDASIFPIHHDRYGIPDAPRRAHVVARPAGAIVEVPASTLRLARTNYPIAGGGYFRLFPYTVSKAAISHLNQRERLPAVVYIHPWEVDPAQPRLPLPPAMRWRHHVGIGTALDKLRNVLADFAFGPVSDVIDAAERAVVPAIAGWAHAK